MQRAAQSEKSNEQQPATAPDVRRSGTRPHASPSARLGQLGADINSAPHVQRLAQMKEDIQRSPRVRDLVQMGDTQMAATGPGAVAQRVKVSVVGRGSQEPDTGSAPLQMVNVTVVRPGTRVSGTLLEVAIAHVTNAVRQAEEQEGKEASGEEHKRLKGVLAHENTLKPKTSRSTFGVGGSQYISGHPFTTTQGPTEFGDSVATVPKIGTTEHLGSRPTGLHDEMHQISAHPGLQALASTQGHCIFCYGTIHGRGYQHGEIRDDPFPQNWEHDYAGFKLKQTSASMEAIEYADCPVIKIESTFGTRYYFVFK